MSAADKATRMQNVPSQSVAALPNGKSPTAGMQNVPSQSAAALPSGKSPPVQNDTNQQGGVAATGAELLAPRPVNPATAVADSKLPVVDKPTALQDGSGRWMIAFPNGRSLDMQTYVDRQGSVTAAIEYVQNLIAQETDAERLYYRKQQLHALTQMSRGSK